jgi:hypothetical protein
MQVHQQNLDIIGREYEGKPLSVVVIRVECFLKEFENVVPVAFQWPGLTTALRTGGATTGRSRTGMHIRLRHRWGPTGPGNRGHGFLEGLRVMWDLPGTVRYQEGSKIPTIF